jgi:hypothetical protein
MTRTLKGLSLVTSPGSYCIMQGVFGLSMILILILYIL